MSTVIDTYQIQFLKRIDNNRTMKLLYSVNGVLSRFIGDYKTPAEINNFLLSEIGPVLSGITSSTTVVSESMICAAIAATTTNLYKNPDYLLTDPADYSIPTTDLNAIAGAWLTYVSAN